MNVDKRTLDLAREWAEKVGVNHPHIDENKKAAAEVIQALPEEWVDAEKVQDLAENYQTIVDESSSIHPQVSARSVLASIKDLLPVPTSRVEVRMGEWAMHPKHGKVMIVSDVPSPSDEVVVAYKDEKERNHSHGFMSVLVALAELSPLSESEEKPRVLTTTEDYRSALTGTVVRESDEHVAFEKLGWNGWNGTLGEQEMDHTMGGTSRTVLWEPEAEPEFDPKYKYRDRDGDIWFSDPTHKVWFCKADWLANGLDAPPADLGPYTKIGGENLQS